MTDKYVEMVVEHVIYRYFGAGHLALPWRLKNRRCDQPISAGANA